MTYKLKGIEGIILFSNKTAGRMLDIEDLT